MDAVEACIALASCHFKRFTRFRANFGAYSIDTETLTDPCMISTQPALFQRGHVRSLVHRLMKRKVTAPRQPFGPCSSVLRPGSSNGFDRAIPRSAEAPSAGM